MKIWSTKVEFENSLKFEWQDEIPNDLCISKSWLWIRVKNWSSKFYLKMEILYKVTNFKKIWNNKLKFGLNFDFEMTNTIDRFWFWNFGGFWFWNFGEFRNDKW